MTCSQLRSRMGDFGRLARRLLRDEAAASAVFIAVSVSSTIGVVGMGVETGLWFAERRQYQTAADAGAIAGALSMVSQLNANNSATPTLDTTNAGPAWTEAVRNGASTFVANASVQQLTGPTRVRVEVVEQKDTLFAQISSLASVTIAATAEAQVDDLGQPCINGLGTTKTVISIQGSATVNAPSCVLTSNSTASGTSTSNGNNEASVTIQGGNNTSVRVGQIYSLGSIVTGGDPNVNAPLAGMGSAAGTANPFSSFTAPATPTAPTAPTITSVTSPNGNTCTATVPSSGGSIPQGVLCALPAGKNPANGAVTLSGHSWTTTGTDSVKGALTVASGATLTVPSGSTLNVFGNLTVAGTLSVSGTLYVNGVLTSSGTMTLNSGATVDGNSGGLTISGGTTSIAGTVNIAKGDFAISGGSTTVTSTINLVNGNFSVSAGTASIRNTNVVAGNFSVSGSTTAVTVNGDVKLGSGNLAVSGGTLTLTGSPYANIGLTAGNFAITGGTTYLNGVAIVAGNFSIGSGGEIRTASGGHTSILLKGTTGYFDFNSNSTTNLTAFDSGTYKGIALYQDAAYTGNKDNNIGGNYSTIVGAIYAPSGTVNFGGNSGSNCTIIVAKVINFSGNSELNTSGCSNYVDLPHFYKVSLSQ